MSTILDGHVHITPGEPHPERLIEQMGAAGVGGGVLLSLPPKVFGNISLGRTDGQEPPARLENLMQWVQGDLELYPFFWIDPMEDDAVGQVEQAVQHDVAGFKVIASHHDPVAPKALDVYRAIAGTGRAMLFHSGILWDGKPSSQYNRPAGFEALQTVPGLRYALAHISWPWVDEHVALYGKVHRARDWKVEPPAEMFIDTTPGTPPTYREEALRKVFTVGYEVEDNVQFGSDNRTDEYDIPWVTGHVKRDRDILDTLDVSAEVQQKVFAENLRRFIGTPGEAYR